MRIIWVGLCIALLGGAAQASVVNADPSIRCTDYFGGEPDLKPDELALVPEGGVLTICRQKGKSEPISYRNVSKPVLGEQNICRVTRSGVIHAAIAQGGTCPGPTDPIYCQLLDKASDEDFLIARQIFERMKQGPGVPEANSDKLVRFADLNIAADRIKGVGALQPDSPDQAAAAFWIEVQIGLGRRDLQFETKDGQTRFTGFR